MPAAAAGRPKATPIDRERPFALEELFFSATDGKGIIRSSNEVFLRVSGLSADEMLGRAHNIVRHPDMPRAVFHLLWEHLLDGKGIAAYVKNLASDGSYYWVMASAVPVEDGYLSVRLKPTSPLLAQVVDIYRDVRQVELAIEADGPRARKDAIAAGRARLDERLAEAGYADYAAFMHAALPAEVTARADALDATAMAVQAGGADRDGLHGVLRAGRAALTELDGLVANITQYAEVGRSLDEGSRFILGLADDIRLFSLNAVLAASRLGDHGRSLGAVAANMRACSDGAGPDIEGLHGDIGGAIDTLAEAGFRIAATRLQAEMLTVFAAEVLAGGAEVSRVAPELALLAAALGDGTRLLTGTLEAVDEHFAGLVRSVGGVERHLGVLRALEVNGRVEAARAPDSESVQALFSTIAEQVGSAREEMGQFSAARKIAATAHRAIGQRIQRDVDAVASTIGGLQAA